MKFLSSIFVFVPFLGRGRRIEKYISQNINILGNIFSLCPFCHRAIHHADKDLTRDIIEKLSLKRPQLLQMINIKTTDLFGFYAVENIE
jgi:5-methylcytosine-specific restriction enzyme A